MINWEEAPEGTTHFFTRAGGQWWIKRIGDAYHWWPFRVGGWHGVDMAGGGGNFHLLDPNSLYAFGQQEPIGVEPFDGANPFDVVVEQPKRKVGWW